MRILYIGDSGAGSTSYHRAAALKRIGADVILADPYQGAGGALKGRIVRSLHYQSGYRLLQPAMQKWTAELVANSSGVDAVLVNAGELLGAGCVSLLRRLGVPVALYNNDDPTGGNSGRRFLSLMNAIPHYDLCVVMRDLNVPEYYAAGARRVVREWMGYDEVAHRYVDSGAEIPSQYKSEVAFIGTWMRGERRDDLLAALVNAGVPVSIWGHRWERSPRYSVLKPYVRGGNLTGDNYRFAVAGAKVCLGLLARRNRDLHTSRSLEIPHIGGLLCAERTSEHLALYEEGKEAVFWSTFDECASKCLHLLGNEAVRNSVRMAGTRRLAMHSRGNEAKMKRLADELGRLAKEAA